MAADCCTSAGPCPHAPVITDADAREYLAELALDDVEWAKGLDRGAAMVALRLSWGR